MRKKASFLLLMIFQAVLAHALDPFNYTVQPKNFSDEIYRADISRYRLTSSNSEFTLPSGPHQSVTRQAVTGGKKIIEIMAGARQAAGERLDRPDEYLKDTRFLCLASPEITEAASRLGERKDPLRAVEDFVYGHISEKTYGIPLIPAPQVYRIKKGDCTEHGVLAVALLRKLGIPARAVVGMYLADEFLGKKNVFVFHLWAEAYWNGGWRTVDATRPGGAHRNRYIALAEHNLRAETPLPYLRAVSAIQDLTVEYLGK